MTAFFRHIRSGEIAEIKSLLSQDTSLLEGKDPKGFPPLILASYNNQLPTTEFLLDAGANINALDVAANTALIGVAFKGYVDIAQLLIERGVNVNHQNNNGATALIYAAMFNQVEIIKLLLASGADKEIKDNQDKTAVMYAQMKDLSGATALL